VSLMARIRLAVHVFSLLLVPAFFGCGGKGSTKLPPIGFKVEFTGHRVPGEMTVGQRLLAAVSFKNASPRTWPSKPNSKGLNAVNLSYHWLDQKDRPVVFDGLRTPLPHDLSPGEAVQLNAAIQAPDQPGRYTLEVTLVQEGVAWFPERDGDKIAVPVKVSEAAAETSGVSHALTTEAGKTASPSKKASHADKVKKSAPAKKLSVETPVQKEHTKPRKVKAAASRSSRARQTHPWSIQVGSYSVEKQAEALAKELKHKGYESYVAVAEVRGKKWYRVRVGHLASKEEAERLQKKLIGMEGFKQALVTNRK
jgi:cell division protein FtsN